MVENTGSFCFRAWLLPDDPAEVATWSHELDPMHAKSIPVSEWAENHLRDCDLYELLGLDRTKAWQVVGHGTIYGRYDNWSGEWDENVDLDTDFCAEIPAEYLDAISGNEINYPQDTEGV